MCVCASRAGLDLTCLLASATAHSLYSTVAVDIIRLPLTIKTTFYNKTSRSQPHFSNPRTQVRSDT